MKDTEMRIEDNTGATLREEIIRKSSSSGKPSQLVRPHKMTGLYVLLSRGGMVEIALHFDPWRSTGPALQFSDAKQRAIWSNIQLKI